MNCEQARGVYTAEAVTPEGFVQKILQKFPGVIPFLEAHARNFLNGISNPFHEKVAALSGVKGNFYTVHVDDNDPVAERVHTVLSDWAGPLLLSRYFTNLLGNKVKIGAICCSGCAFTDDSIGEGDILSIQFAAVQVEADGSVVEIAA